MSFVHEFDGLPHSPAPLQWSACGLLAVAQEDSVVVLHPHGQPRLKESGGGAAGLAAAGAHALYMASEHSPAVTMTYTPRTGAEGCDDDDDDNDDDDKDDDDIGGGHDDDNNSNSKYKNDDNGGGGSDLAAEVNKGASEGPDERGPLQRCAEAIQWGRARVVLEHRGGAVQGIFTQPAGAGAGSFLAAAIRSASRYPGVTPFRFTTIQV